MAKRRMLSQEIIYDENFNSLSIEAQTLFIRLLVVSDDYGFVPANEYTLVTLTNPHPKIKKNFNRYMAEITDKELGFILEYNGNKFFSFKKDTFDCYQSYVIAKRTKSEYLKLSKEEIESEKFQEFLGKFRKVISDDIVSNKIKDKSRKKKVERVAGKNHELVEWIIKNAPKIEEMVEPLTNEQCVALLFDFPEDVIKKKLLAMHNYQKLLTNNRSANLTLRNWVAKDDSIKPNLLPIYKRLQP